MRIRAWDGAKHLQGADGRTRRRAFAPGSERGATAVEFALVLSVLMILLFGVIQFGIAYGRYQGLHAGAREGGRFGASSQATIAQIQQRVRDSITVFDTSNARFVNPCPATPATMSAQSFCINVLRRDTPSSGATLLTTNGNNSSLQPCNLASGKSVIVNVYYRMPIQIPLWAVTTLTAQGVGEFRCQS
jgi:Flp pilus assembly protein TadG